MKKRILIINTGGTISSVITERGYQPAADYMQQALEQIQALTHPDMPAYHLIDYQPLLDSANMTVNDWNKIGRDIARHYEEFDGFVVFHGTDTMAYTASALSFMLENLAKPVIITGSQIPLAEIRNDASDNIITSLWLCAHQPINEVCIYFNQRLLRGNRAQKINAERFDAFDSPKYPHLATIGININVHENYLQPAAINDFCLQTIEHCYIANLRLFPGFVNDILNYLLNQPLQGLVLETYGTGNAALNPQFLQLLQEACAKGIVIVNCTQCQQGRVKMEQYATGHALKQAGLISGHDMTPEAAHCKLLYLFSKKLGVEQVKNLMETNLRGELSR